ncbi:MAG: aminotransferase class I/II-fold pyridoxal phosphate-dependent enzyme [Steroidobacteraceae bacterium]
MRGPSVTPFYAGDIGVRGAARVRAGLPFVPMHYGQPSAGAPAAAIAAAHRVIDRDPLGYTELVELRERIARHYAEAHGLEVDPARILLTAGASAALVAAYATMFRPGDRVAVLRPGYPAYRNTLTALNLMPVEIHCGPEQGFHPTRAQIEALSPAPQALLVASPANPTGAMLDATQLGELVATCRTRGIRVISDEIYHGISFGQRAVSALEIDPRAVVINSFSKLYRMPGWRLGWMVVPQDWAARIHAVLINMFLTPSTLAQHAALAAMDEREDLERWVRIYAQNRTRLIEGLAALGIRKIVPPDGAFYLYADIGHLTRDSMQFCLRAVDECGVGLAPGIDFDPVDGQRFVRFSFAVTPEEVEDALGRLAAWLPGYADHGAGASA